MQETFANVLFCKDGLTAIHRMWVSGAVSDRYVDGLRCQVCLNGRVQHLEHLLFYGADVNAQNTSGDTPLHICASHNQVAYHRTVYSTSALCCQIAANAMQISWYDPPPCTWVLCSSDCFAAVDSGGISIITSDRRSQTSANNSATIWQKQPDLSLSRIEFCLIKYLQKIWITTKIWSHPSWTMCSFSKKCRKNPFIIDWVIQSTDGRTNCVT